MVDAPECTSRARVHPASAALNFAPAASDNEGVDQVSRPMQIALVAVVLLAGMWFTVLKPKPADDTASVTPATPTPTATTSATKVAPGVTGLTKAVDKAKAASAKSDATNAKIQAATGSKPAASNATAPAKAKATKSVAATKTTAKAKTLTQTPAAKPKTKAKATTDTASTVDPSDRLLAFLAKGKTLVVLFEGKGSDDKAARKAVHETAKADPKHVVSAYVPIGKVGDYEKITSDVQVYGSPTILVIGADRKATALTGFVDAPSIQQAVGDARREAAAAKKK
jgi:hypothetical protein